MHLVLGTRNRKKGIELAELLVPWGFELITLADMPDSIEVEETGRHLCRKRRPQSHTASRTSPPLGPRRRQWPRRRCPLRRPGVYSARFSGHGATDESNNRLLLEKLGKTPLEKRTAHYVCHATLADPTGQIRAEAEGYCHGRIRFEPAGAGGFGYDPLFEIVEYHRTFGELGPAVKAALSHRARAIRQLIPAMLRLADTGHWK